MGPGKLLRSAGWVMVAAVVAVVVVGTVGSSKAAVSFCPGVPGLVWADASGGDVRGAVGSRGVQYEWLRVPTAITAGMKRGPGTEYRRTGNLLSAHANRKYRVENQSVFGSGSTESSLPRQILVFLVQFEKDDNEKTSGDGTFRNYAGWPDNFPHDKAYFRRLLDHLEAYWATVSCSLYTPVFELHPDVNPSAPPLFTMTREMAYYGEDDASGAAELTRDLVSVADPFFDFSKFDGIMIIHAGCGQETDILGDSPDDIWSTYLAECDIDRILGTSGGVPTDDGTTIKRIAVIPETETWDASEGDYSGVFAQLGVYVHEFAHYLDLPDLYDTESPPALDSWGIGSWGIMGLGAWNAAGFCPPHPCAWIKAKLGWVHVEKAVRSGSDHTLGLVEERTADGEKPTVLLVPLTPEEYFLIENRFQDGNGDGRFTFSSSTPGDTILDFFDPNADDSMEGAEFDYFLPGEGKGSGLLIWHVDEEMIEAGSDPCIDTVNNDKDRKGVDLEEADGIQNLDRIPGDWGSGYDSWRSDDYSVSFDAWSIPSTVGNNGGRSHVAVDSIGPAGRVMKFSVKWRLRETGWPVELPDMITGDCLSVGDLDGDGMREIIVTTGDGNIYILKADGTPLVEKYEAVHLDSGFSGPSALFDFDGDGDFEIVAAATNGNLYAWDCDVDSGRLNLLKGWPQYTGGEILVPPVLTPEGFIAICISHKDSGEVYTTGEVKVFTDDGVLDKKFELDGYITSKPALSGGDTLIVPVSDGDLYTLDLLSGEIIRSTKITEGAPGRVLAADLDRDGSGDIAVVTPDGRVFFVKENGTIFPGMPYLTGGGCAAAPGISDRNSDGYPEVLVLSGEHPTLRTVGNYGGPLVDSPAVLLETRDATLAFARTTPLSADFGAGMLVIASSAYGPIHGLDQENGDWEVFPLLNYGMVYATPLITDLEEDGNNEIVVATSSGTEDSVIIDVWRPADAEAGGGSSEILWGSTGGDPRLSSLFDVTDLGEPSADTTAAVLKGKVFCAPNPVYGDLVSIYYSLSHSAEYIRLRIFTADGRMVCSKKESGNLFVSPGAYTRVTWDRGSMACGIYIAELTVSDGKRIEERRLKFALASGK